MTVQEIYDALTKNTVTTTKAVATFQTLVTEAEADRASRRSRFGYATTTVAGSIFKVELSRSPYGNSSVMCYLGAVDAKIKRVARAVFDSALAEAQGLTAPAGKKSSGTTCQICARRIEMVGGLVAHHGYTRPGAGYQTDSCPGARELPYELSCDLIPPVILNYHARAVQLRIHAIDHIYECPAIQQPPLKKRSFQTGRTTLEKRPDITVGTARYRDEQRYYLAQIKHTVEMLEQNIAFLRKRVKDWTKKEVLI